MRVINARLSNVSYDIHVQNGLLNTLGSQLAAWYKGDVIAVVTDSNVDQLYGSAMETILTNAGYKVHKIIIAPGEQSKSLINLNYVYNKLAEGEINRGNLIIAFGGGVVGDLTGFAAATYMRGIPFYSSSNNSYISDRQQFRWKDRYKPKSRQKPCWLLLSSQGCLYRPKPFGNLTSKSLHRWISGSS